MLQAIADKLIPGIPPSLRVHIVSQVAEGGSEDTSETGQRTAVQRVLDGHVERTDALREREGGYPSDINIPFTGDLIRANGLQC